MKKSGARPLERPQYDDISEKVSDQVKSGKLRLPMEDKLTVGRLIQSGAFDGVALSMQDAETEIIANMATAKIHGMDGRGAYPEYMIGERSADTTPRQEIERRLQGLHHHRSFGLIKGEQSEKQYVAELDKAAQRFVEANYPDRPR